MDGRPPVATWRRLRALRIRCRILRVRVLRAHALRNEPAALQRRANLATIRGNQLAVVAIVLAAYGIWYDPSPSPDSERNPLPEDAPGDTLPEDGASQPAPPATPPQDPPPEPRKCYDVLGRETECPSDKCPENPARCDAAADGKP